MLDVETTEADLQVKSVPDGQHAQQVHRALDKRPHGQRQLLRLSYYKELSNAAIAKWLGLSIVTVKSQIHLAMEEIRVGLKNQQ